MNSATSEGDQRLRERIKMAIQTAQDQEGRLLYVIPPGGGGHLRRCSPPRGYFSVG